MTRVSETRLVQRVDDLLVLMDEGTGVELTIPEQDVPAFRRAIASAATTFETDEGRIDFEPADMPRVEKALDVLFP